MGKGSIRHFVLDKINAYPEWDYAEWAVTNYDIGHYIGSYVKRCELFVTQLGATLYKSTILLHVLLFILILFYEKSAPRLINYI